MRKKQLGIAHYALAVVSDTVQKYNGVTIGIRRMCKPASKHDAI
jgi:hypothetical protein